MGRGSYYLERRGDYQARVISGGNADDSLTVNGSAGAIQEVALSGAAITDATIKYVTIWSTVDTNCIQTSEKGSGSEALEDNDGTTSYGRLPKNTAWPVLVKNLRDYLQFRSATTSSGKLYIIYHEQVD